MQYDDPGYVIIYNNPAALRQQIEVVRLVNPITIQIYMAVVCRLTPGALVCLLVLL